MADDALASGIVGGNSVFGRNKSDFYPTPPEVTQALLDFLKLEPMQTIWEPACGDWHMANVLIENNLAVIGTDIKYGTDFLTAELPKGVDFIITNPPFSQSEAFIRKCASHHVPFALLLKSQYWHAARRLSLFLEHPPMYVLPLTWRPDFTFKTRGKGYPLMDVIWCVWDAETTHTEYIPLAKPTELNVIDIEANLPHEVCEVMCWCCGRRWIAVFPAATPLKGLECPCGKVGYVFKTGQTMADNLEG